MRIVPNDPWGQKLAGWLLSGTGQGQGTGPDGVGERACTDLDGSGWLGWWWL